MEDTDQRLMYGNKCAPPSHHAIVVNQVIGERSEQEAFDIHICIPRSKPAAEQIINVFVKKLRITHVNLITDKVIVRGDFEVKAIYVGCAPCQPVHAVEIKCVRFTIDLPIWGARCGMETDAAVMVEYINFDDGCDYKVRDERYKNKYGKIKKQHINCEYDHDYDQCHQDYNHHQKDYCHDKCHKDHGHHHQDDCHKDHAHHHQDDCHKDYGHHHQDDCHKDHGHHHQDDCHKDHGHHHKDHCCHSHCTREFDVSVVLRVNAKVMIGRELMVNPVYPKMITYPNISIYPQMPAKPKG